MGKSEKTDRIIKGQLGEDLACQYLEGLGFEIIERNYRYRKAEVDVIALKNDLLLFVEVKFRKDNSYGYPEEFVSDRQQQLILNGADDYIAQIKWEGHIRFDIIAIDRQHEIMHFEDAFY